MAKADSQASPVVQTAIHLGSPGNLDLLNDISADRSGMTVEDVNRYVTTPTIYRVVVLPSRRRPPGLLRELVRRISVSEIAASVRLIPIWRPWNILILLKENTMASRRNDKGNQTSQSDLLQPLPPEERPATIGPDDVRKLVASVDELKTLIVERSGPDESNNAAIQEAMNGILGAIEVFMNRQNELLEANSSTLTLVQKALSNNLETLTSILSEPGKTDRKAGPAVAEILEPLIGVIAEGFRNIQERHTELLKTHSESNRGIVEALEQVQGRPAPATVSLEALDNWRDDCIKRLEAAGGTRPSVGEIGAELDRIDRVSGRMTMLKDEFEKLKIEIAEGFRTSRQSSTITATIMAPGLVN